MTLHYHSADINPLSAFYAMTGRHFCVSYHYPKNVERCHQIGQSVMLDNGAFSVWRSGARPDWSGFYSWADPWLDCPTTWAVIPDVIAGADEDQDDLIRQWPFGWKGSPVWHMHESINRLKRLVDEWPLVCMGSSAQYAVVLSEAWSRRMDEAWNAIGRGRRTPSVHMLRGMNCSGRRWPFYSVDSADIARNHNRPQNTARGMADRWDAQQCGVRWEQQPEQMVML
jgi:hypothetical protein